MSEGVIRLRAQHRRYPHCPACARDVPRFDDTYMLSDAGGATLYAVTFHITCACGQRLDVTRTIANGG